MGMMLTPLPWSEPSLYSCMEGPEARAAPETDGKKARGGNGEEGGGKEKGGQSSGGEGRECKQEFSVRVNSREALGSMADGAKAAAEAKHDNKATALGITNEVEMGDESFSPQHNCTMRYPSLPQSKYHSITSSRMNV
eukprot:759091-Hanusia_phi.AAC.3